MGEREEAEDGELHPPTEDAIKNVLVFADGLAVMHTGLALADLYAEDCESAQGVLRWAGCHEATRGSEHQRATSPEADVRSEQSEANRTDAKEEG
jgi:hypothetical protein